MRVLKIQAQEADILEGAMQEALGIEPEGDYIYWFSDAEGDFQRKIEERITALVDGTGLEKKTLRGDKDTGRTWTAYRMPPSKAGPVNEIMKDEGMFPFRPLSGTGQTFLLDYPDTPWQRVASGPHTLTRKAQEDDDILGDSVNQIVNEMIWAEEAPERTEYYVYHIGGAPGPWMERLERAIWKEGLPMEKKDLNLPAMGAHFVIYRIPIGYTPILDPFVKERKLPAFFKETRKHAIFKLKEFQAVPWERVSPQTSAAWDVNKSQTLQVNQGADIRLRAQEEDDVLDRAVMEILSPHRAFVYYLAGPQELEDVENAMRRANIPLQRAGTEIDGHYTLYRTPRDPGYPEDPASMTSPRGKYRFHIYSFPDDGSATSSLEKAAIGPWNRVATRLVAQEEDDTDSIIMDSIIDFLPRTDPDPDYVYCGIFFGARTDQVESILAVGIPLDEKYIGDRYIYRAPAGTEEVLNAVSSLPFKQVKTEDLVFPPDLNRQFNALPWKRVSGGSAGSPS